MPLDIYSTRAQLAAIDLLPREYSFLFDTFARDAGAVEDTKAIYDYRKGSRRIYGYDPRYSPAGRGDAK